LKRQSLAGVPASDVDDQSQVRPDHLVAGFGVARLDPASQGFFLVGGE
jgi:hypothetical protein